MRGRVRELFALLPVIENLAILAAMIEQIDHINIVVDDLVAMTRFYRDALGLRVTKEVSIHGEWISRTVGLRDAVADVVYLEAPQGARIELIQYRSPDGVRPAGSDAPNAKGIRHLAFRVIGIEEQVAALRRAHVAFTSEIQQVPDSQVTYAGGARKRLVYFRDVEGNLLEFRVYA